MTVVHGEVGAAKIFRTGNFKNDFPNSRSLSTLEKCHSWLPYGIPRIGYESPKHVFTFLFHYGEDTGVFYTVKKRTIKVMGLLKFPMEGRRFLFKPNPCCLPWFNAREITILYQALCEEIFERNSVNTKWIRQRMEWNCPKYPTV